MTSYDASGNLTRDGRKRLEFTHNVLNLPMSVRERDASGQHMTGDITYTYLGDGTKVSARVGSYPSVDWDTDGPAIDPFAPVIDSTGLIAPPFPGRPTIPRGRTLAEDALSLHEGGIFSVDEVLARPGAAYRGSFVYDIGGDGSQTLQSVAVSTGRLIALTGTNGAVSFESDGFVTDHLGNVAAVVNLSASSSTSTGAFILEQNGYHPFGTKIDLGCNLSTNRWRYAGKEEQDIAGMDLRLLDFGARFYDPYTLRWNAVDPLASSYLSSSPYVYCNNSPVNIVDPIGMNWYSYTDENGETQYKYVEGQMSRKEMKEGGYKDCGQTMEVNGQYYSLFGAIVPMVDNNGFEVGKAYKVIDKMIRKYYDPKEISNQDDNSMIKYDVHGRNFMFNYCGKEFSSSKDGTICYPSNEKTWRGIQMTGADNLIVKEAFSSEHPLPKEMSGKLFSNHNWPSGYWLIGIDASPTATDQVLIQVRFDKNNKDALMKAIKKQFGK